MTQRSLDSSFGHRSGIVVGADYPIEHQQHVAALAVHRRRYSQVRGFVQLRGRAVEGNGLVHPAVGAADITKAPAHGGFEDQVGGRIARVPDVVEDRGSNSA